MNPSLPTTILAPNIALSLPASFPVALSTDQQHLVAQNLASTDFLTVSTRDIVTLGSDTEVALHRTLDGFLSKIDQGSDPKIFKLIASLKKAVAKEDLPALAQRIINPQPTLLNKLAGLFNKNALAKALADAWQETRRLAMGKTKTLVDVVQKMDGELRVEQQKLDAEIQSLEQLKDAYRERYSDFVITVAFLSCFLAQSKDLVARQEQHALAPSNLQNNTQNDPQNAARITELKDKLQALESRTLALEGTLTRLPGDQLVIRQLQNAAISALQETTTTAASRFASIKMTLLTIHGALVTQSVQQLAAQGAALDANLVGVRSVLMKEVVGKAANDPGDNRLAQAQQLQGIVADTAQLVQLVENARADNQRKFDEARELFAKARQDMLALGQQLRPDQALKY
jgi:hypothetical protein